jgi:Zn-finger nucleic acid-binding protein
MNCPGCAADTSTVPLTDRSGAPFEVDVCRACRAFWFDRNENTRLSPGSTLTLFNLMAEHGPGGAPLPQSLACPRCRGRLALRHDMQQKGTRFEYWRCDQHGHFITFLQFLKEKDFVRPLTPAQIADLRKNVQTVNCSNCGGAIDLVKQAVCPFCASPLSMIDMPQIAAHVQELQHQHDEAEAAAAPPPDGVRVTRVVTSTVRSFGFGRSQTVKTTTTTTTSGKDDEADRLLAEALAAMANRSGPQSIVHAGLSLALKRFSQK